MTTSETEHVSEAAEQPRTDANDHERLGRVEAAVERIEKAIAKVVPGSRAEAQDRTEERLDRPSSVEEQVRAELEKARREEQEAAEASAKQAEETSLKERVAKLEETPPAPPSLKRTKLLGWGDGRGG